MKTPFQLFDYFKISIIQDDIDNVARNLNHILSGFSFKQKELLKVDFERVCSTESIPYRSETTKFLLFEPLTNPGSTVFFSNVYDGWYTAIYNYARLKCKNAYQLGFTMDESKTSPAYFFTFFYIDKGHITTRTVYAIREEYKWIFFANEKTPLAIEDTNNYLKRKIKDRINNEIILNYLQKANYNLRDINFYTSSKKTLLFFE